MSIHQQPPGLQTSCYPSLRKDLKGLASRYASLSKLEKGLLPTPLPGLPGWLLDPTWVTLASDPLPQGYVPV